MFEEPVKCAGGTCHGHTLDAYMSIAYMRKQDSCTVVITHYSVTDFIFSVAWTI